MKNKKILLFSMLFVIALILFVPNAVKAVDDNSVEFLYENTTLEYEINPETGTARVLSCVSLEENGNLRIPEKIIVNNSEYSVTSIYSLAFMKNINLKSVYIPDSVTLIDTYAFAYCSNLEEVRLPSGLSVLPADIFEQCTSLTTVEIPTSVTEMQQGVFYKCTSLKNVSIPDSVEKIWRAAFYGCTNLESVAIPPTAKDIDDTAFNYCPNLTIKCSNNSKAHEIAKSLGISYDMIFYNVEYSINNLSCKDSIYVEIGKDYSSVLLPNVGYKNPSNISIEINGIGLSSDEYEYNSETGVVKISAENIDGDIKIIAEGEKVYTYTFITGENQTFILNTSTEYSFKVDGDYLLFNKLVINDLNLIKDVDYTVTEGSTIIIFTETGLAKLNTLKVGTYDVVAKYSNDKDVSGKLTIEVDKTIDNDLEKEPDDDKIKDDNSEKVPDDDKIKDDNSEKVPDNNGTPQTGDNISLFVGMFVVAVIGIIVTTKIRKKN